MPIPRVNLDALRRAAKQSSDAENVPTTTIILPDNPHLESEQHNQGLAGALYGLGRTQTVTKTEAMKAVESRSE